MQQVGDRTATGAARTPVALRIARQAAQGLLASPAVPARAPKRGEPCRIPPRRRPHFSISRARADNCGMPAGPARRNGRLAAWPRQLRKVELRRDRDVPPIAIPDRGNRHHGDHQHGDHHHGERYHRDRHRGDRHCGDRCCVAPYRGDPPGLGSVRRPRRQRLWRLRRLGRLRPRRRRLGLEATPLGGNAAPALRRARLAHVSPVQDQPVMRVAQQLRRHPPEQRVEIKPGATTLPPASIVRFRGAAARLPMAATFPSRMPTSPEYQGEPVPSMMCPLVMTRSNDGTLCADTAATATQRRARIINGCNARSFISIFLEPEWRRIIKHASAHRSSRAAQRRNSDACMVVSTILRMKLRPLHRASCDSAVLPCDVPKKQ